MIKGEYLNKEIKDDERNQLIINYLNDYVEVLSTVNLIAT